MASVFNPPGTSTWYAKVRAWDAAKGAWTWRKLSTGARDRDTAQGIADRLESASGEAKAGTMTREKAAGLVSTILHLAGLEWASGAPTIEAIGDELFEGRAANVGTSTRRKYAAHWRRFKEWAGDNLERPVSDWTPPEFRAYYVNLRKEVSDTTANNHMTTLSMVLMRAEAAGHIRGNPIALVERAGNDSVEKRLITRAEFDALMKAMAGNEPWQCLTLLGWHTGHRLQDLLSLTAANVGKSGKHDVITFAPQKKRGKGRTVVLPIPVHVAKMLTRLGDLKAIRGASNRQGRVSDDFVQWLKAAGIDPLPTKRGKRTIHLKSFHSFRHSMASRLTAAGVSGDLARLVTDHESAKVQKTYVHAEVEALAGALKLARRK